ncbi:hypothetical protein RW1_056_00270 [Rhodococcus wratislaviensis NBRC 100605]|uniref:Uncharacterized protein n=1 Tax=Rhodococcus wratislaviensis NBRC 100605 TaxID=1219028 RepID=X0PYF3_RHOWR|nr:hypothetical protein RW1_056_00270 [Rhodococcus wratislaviensis NBRC 100605]
MVELVFTFVLCCLVIEVTPRTRPDHSFFDLAIGFTVVAGAFTAGALAGGAFDPAVTLAAGAGTAPRDSRSPPSTRRHMILRRSITGMGLGLGTAAPANNPYRQAVTNR